MEALGAVASIGGIIQLAVHGIAAINFLRRVFEVYQDGACEEFVRGLIHSGQLLQDVQSLCLRIQQHQNLSVSKIRTASLRFQLDDCINDLEAWQSIAKRTERTERSNLYLGVGAKNKQFFQRAFDIKNALATPDAQRTIQQRFHQHQTRIRTALSLLHADLSFVQIDGVENVTAQLGTLVEYAAKQEKQGQRNSSDMQSSGSSTLASSKSHDERLRELESLSSSISEKLDVLIRSLPSHSSTHSSAASDHASVPNTKSEHGNSGRLSHAMEEQVNGREKLELKNDREFQETRTEASTVDGDLDSVFASLDDFHTLAGQHFDGVIAEYVSTAEVWRAAHIRGMLLAIVEKSPEAPRIKFNNELPIDICRLAGRLLSLRRRAEQESLSDAVEEADEVLGISADLVASWEELTDLRQRQHYQGQPLRLDHHTARVNPGESHVRLNEWFLTVMFANSHLAALHQLMISRLVQSAKPVSNSAFYILLGEDIARKVGIDFDQSHGSVQSRDLWERLTIKSWFFDQTSLPSAAGYAASHFANSAESDMTVMASSDDIDGEVDDIEGGLDTEAQLIRQVITIPRFSLPENCEGIDLAPEKATECNLTRAADALQEYGEEPARPLSDDMLTALAKAAKKQPVKLKPLWTVDNLKFVDTTENTWGPLAARA